ncbi:LLM class flavin-dependent oxidoreductase [Prauserella rugosa]|uniref:Luciferase-like monooxygenase n=1 Tax=Prauserella rugosa TaxID=43354 RepID=A0A660CEQ2_9PSEU|nr:LLM class flavin-dependent oxidoreductase [Prauserella rugosa]TWH21816.1 luciferase-like monooxygenase [Prauserella rugosa]
MRIGLTILPEHPKAAARDIWAQVEEAGFDHGWTFDHIGWEGLLDEPWYGAVSTLSLAALSTTRLEIGPLVGNPNVRGPVAFARELIGLDELSDGRLTLGVGAGAATGYDVDAADAPPPRSRMRRFREFVEFLDRLLTEDRVSYTGEYYTALDARHAPGCRRRPRLPFLVAANGVRSVTLAARQGQGWVTIGGMADTLDDWWHLVTAASERMTTALEQAGRADDTDFRRVLQTDAAPVLSIQSAECFADFVGLAVVSLTVYR